jgi:hypothetical protein
MAKDAFEDARKAIRDAEAAGQSNIEIKKVHALLNLIEAEVKDSSVEHSSSEADLEAYKAQLTKWVADNQHNNEADLESFRQILALGQSTVRSAILINGGAAVALLAFIGHLSTSAVVKFTILPFAGALRLFVFGVFFASLAAGSMYFSQFFYDREKTWHQRTGAVFHLLTVLLIAVAFILFVLGANQAYSGFLAAQI